MTVQLRRGGGKGPTIKEKRIELKTKKIRRPISSRWGGKALMARQLKKELFAASQ